MRTTDFDFKYPDYLIATEPQDHFRILWNEESTSQPREISKEDLFKKFSPGDVLAINDTKVLPRRITAINGLEILFLENTDSDKKKWQVLFPARDIKDGESFLLPDNLSARLIARGLPQTLEISMELDEKYFIEHGELALPPYIQKARNQRRNYKHENKWYQTQWCKNPGSFAAPTASLHFSLDDLEQLKNNYGVVIAPFTLHVGLGTFLPMKTTNINDHEMHPEFVHLPKTSIDVMITAKKNGKKIWALGTTATRALESWGHGLLTADLSGDVTGFTQLFIRPGFKFEVVDKLLTNFHQPHSTLMVLVSAFAGRERVITSYEWAVKNNFRLFSYGDLTVWTK